MKAKYFARINFREFSENSRNSRKCLPAKISLIKVSYREILFEKKDNPLSDGIKRAYNLFRNRITREIKKAKKVYYKNYFPGNINNMKNLWKGIKNILNINKKEDSRISQLSHNGKNINNNLDMANSFNEFFTGVGPKLNKQIPNSNILRNPNVYLPPRIPCSISLYHSTPKGN